MNRKEREGKGRRVAASQGPASGYIDLPHFGCGKTLLDCPEPRSGRRLTRLAVPLVTLVRSSLPTHGSFY